MNIAKLISKIMIIPTSIYIYGEGWFNKTVSKGFYRNLMRLNTLPAPKTRNFLINAIVNYGFLYSLSIKKFGILGGICWIGNQKINKNSKSAIFNSIKSDCKCYIHDEEIKQYNTLAKVPLNYKGMTDCTSLLDIIRKAVTSDNVKVVSFDIFDTLLIRSVLKPEDVFRIVANIVDDKYKIDYYKYRIDAEKEIGDANCSLYDIYKYLKEKWNISQDDIDEIIKVEVDVEGNLLLPRKEIKEIFDIAVKSQKRIIAISDMYLPEDRLSYILNRKGYCGIKVYCSNRYKKRKDTGDLFEYVIKEENVRSSEIVHIGDNYISDYVNPIQKGIVAYCLPSVLDIVRSGTQWNELLGKFSNNYSVTESLTLGYAIATYGEYCRKYGRKIFKDIDSLGWLGVAPVSFLIAFKIIQNNFIQNRYNEILFSARDGYLPYKIYCILRETLQKGLPARYFQAGRRCFLAGRWKTFEDIVKHTGISFEKEKEDSFTLGDFIDEFFIDEKNKKRILNLIPRMFLSCLLNSNKIYEIPENAKCAMIDYFYCQRKYAEKYFVNIFNEDGKVVFDLGYSGSISDGIFDMIGKKIDKIYVWETDKNREKDRCNGTRTTVLFGDLNEIPVNSYHLILEELFSPMEGGCIGFTENGIPVHEQIEFPLQMGRDLNAIHDNCLKFARDIASQLNSLRIFDEKSDKLPYLLAGIVYSPYNEIDYLRNIKFYDAFLVKQKSLASKIQKGNRNYFSQLQWSGFENPDNYISPWFDDFKKSKMKILIHLHIYYVDLLQEISEYLKNIGYDFDILITSSVSEVLDIASVYIENSIDNVDKIIIKKVPNRGRDVAPWIIETKIIADQYDYILHIHGKKSVHADKVYADNWRKHLYSSLMTNNNVNKIFNIFSHERDVGMIFPRPYDAVVNIWDKLNVPVIGDNESVMLMLMHKLNYNYDDILRSDLLFSVGTMMWYRPEAMKSLYEIRLTYNDFPEEPIGIDGTLAHAIERSMKIICETSGYKAKILSDHI